MLIQLTSHRKSYLLALVIVLTGCHGSGGGSASGSGSGPGGGPVQSNKTQTAQDWNGSNITVATSEGFISNLRRVAAPSSAPASFGYGNGFFSFEITGLAQNGASTTVTINLPAGSPVPTSVVKCTGGTCAEFAGASINGATITMTLTDGGAGDADGVVNGRITDPVAPAREVPSDGGGDEGLCAPGQIPLIGGQCLPGTGGGGGGGGGGGSTDDDGDGIDNSTDNCRTSGNAGQENTDSDGAGDACDATPGPDDDGDGMANGSDNCPAKSNPQQLDGDNDGLGDACDTPSGGTTDSDGDGVPDSTDNCPNNANANQADADGDGKGDVCDTPTSGGSGKIYALYNNTDDVRIYMTSFSPSSPGTVSTPIRTGLSWGTVDEIDFRPTDGNLYVFDQSGIQILNAQDGTKVGGSAYDQEFSGDDFTQSFNPNTDKLRWVTRRAPASQVPVKNYRVNPDGSVLARDTDVSPWANFFFVAHGCAPGGGVTTYLVSNTGNLRTLGSPGGAPDTPESGKSHAVGPMAGGPAIGGSSNLAIDRANNVGYIMSGGNGTPPVNTLYSVNLTTGAATALGDVPVAWGIKAIAVDQTGGCP